MPQGPCAWLCLVLPSWHSQCLERNCFSVHFLRLSTAQRSFLNFSDEAMIAGGSTTDTVGQRTAAVGRIWAVFCVAGLLDLLDSFSMTWLQLAHAPLISSYTYHLLSFHMSPFCAQERNEIPMHTLQAVESVRLWDQRWNKIESSKINPIGTARINSTAGRAYKRLNDS